ncbi:hypothetical protein [Telmatospirillum sp.]|uniref:hypothetical protein n=1 Tax=Telmatospirillum sp. TaxID=2079197 RepID=UPI0028473629|nr:hypothetical protein [Telmatospirillum sp.]MDR3435393.1 hypothetical protein [Telmatospirillum sp.]
MSLLSVVLSTLDKVVAARAREIDEEIATRSAATEFEYLLKMKKFEESHPRH